MGLGGEFLAILTFKVEQISSRSYENGSHECDKEVKLLVKMTVEYCSLSLWITTFCIGMFGSTI